jgi:glucose-fructose oxidoreductase
VASFVTSFNAADVGGYQIVGTRGSVTVSPGYEYVDGLSYELTVDGKTTRVRGKRSDQFAPELIHFSDCILKNRTPEPSGDEGLRDVRIVEALYESARKGRRIKLRPLESRRGPTRARRITRPPIEKPRLVKVQSASED